MKKYRSEICKVMHQDAVADFEIGAISEAEMREYDELCFVQEPETAYGEETPVNTEHVAAALG